MNVLISAYACEPNLGSEPGIGWNWALQAARDHKVWVLTREENPGMIEAELAKNPQPNLNFIFHDLPKWAEILTRNSLGFQLHYLLWQLTAIRIVRSFHRKNGFNLVHHVTFGTIRFPSPLAWLDLPFIWGPVAGGEEAPRRLLSTFDRRARLWEELRLLSNRFSRWDPLVRYTAGRAAAIVAVTNDTLLRLHKNDREKACVIPAIGVDSLKTEPSESSYGRDNSDGGVRPIQLVFVGRLLDWKGVHLGLNALAIARSHGALVELVVAGDGPARSRLEALSDSLGLRDIVTFRGSVPRNEVLDLLWQSDIMLFPSMHDSGGFAVLEAMEARLPVICLDLGGPAVSVTNDTGIRIPARGPDQVISDLADAIERLAGDTELRIQMGAAGRKRVESVYTWSTKGVEINALYQRVIAADM